MTDFSTWESLGTFVGVVTMVTAITQYSKGLLDRFFPSIQTRIWVYLFSLFILLANTWVQDRMEPFAIVLDIINAFGVALAAMGSFDAFIEPHCSKPTTRRKSPLN